MTKYGRYKEFIRRKILSEVNLVDGYISDRDSDGTGLDLYSFPDLPVNIVNFYNKYQTSTDNVFYEKYRKHFINLLTKHYSLRTDDAWDIWDKLLYREEYVSIK
jgi:hypothetical protein